MKDHRALEAYRKSRAQQQTSPDEKETSTGSQPVVRPVSSPPHTVPQPSTADPASAAAANAARKCEEWIAADDVQALVANYGLLSNPTKRQKVLTWAVDKAREGNLEPLLAIGIEEVEPNVQKRLDNMLSALPADVLLNRISGRRFTVKERRTVAGLLGRCKHPEAGRMLSSMAAHSDSRVRESALQALAHYPVTRDLQFPIFKHHVERDPNQFVRLRAAEGLARLGTSEALIALEIAARKDSASQEMQAVFAGSQAKRRPRTEEPEGPLPGDKPKAAVRKPVPWNNVGALIAVALILGFAGVRLSPLVRRWYQRTFPPPVPAQPAPTLAVPLPSAPAR